ADGGDDNDDDDDDEEEDKEEHLASVDSTTLPASDHVPSTEDTKEFKIDESTPTPPRSPRLHKARIYVRHQDTDGNIY
ncbi:hypothetical protein Tco_1009541, partial [Tanacetum coccineum]